MHSSSPDPHRTSAPTAPAEVMRREPIGLPFAAAAQLVPAASSTWLALHHQHTAAGVAAAIVGGALVCAAAAVVVTRRHRSAAAAAVRAAVQRAGQDPLTGLPTRAALEAALDRADASGAPFTVALVDVDGLHDINSRWGHAAGDQYLAAIAGRLATAVPAGGCLVRQGGDELTIVTVGDAAGLRARISAALAGAALIAGRQVTLRASVGIAVGAPTDVTGRTAHGAGGDARYVLACADTAMYTVKHRGGGQVLLYRADRDGRPALDGTRPVLRRRDVRPDLPDPQQDDPNGQAAGGRLPVYVTDAERRLLGRLLHNATAARHERVPFAAGDTEVQARLRSIAEHLTTVTNSQRCRGSTR